MTEKKETRFRINVEQDRDDMVRALTNSGYTVRIEKKEAGFASLEQVFYVVVLND